MEIPADFSSFVLGIFFWGLLFILSSAIVIEIKYLLIYVGIIKEKPIKKIKRTRKPVRSIEIDPNEINRISVKKL